MELANQQVTDKEIGYLAAMIEGEGTIALNIRTKKWKGWSGYGADLSIVIANTDKKVIDKCAGIITRLGIPPWIHCYQRAHGWKDCWQVRVSKIRQGAQLLEIVESALAGEKGDKARLVLKFLRHRITQMHSSVSGGSWYTKTDWDLLGAVYDFMKKPFPYGIPRDYTPSAK